MTDRPTPTPAPPLHPVPAGLRVTAAWSWRILVVLALAAAITAVVVRLQVLFIALFVALLATALLQPVLRALRRVGLPRAVAQAGQSDSTEAVQAPGFSRQMLKLSAEAMVTQIR